MTDIIKLMQSQPNLYVLKGATEADVSLAEKKLSLQFSIEYTQYVRAFGVASFAGHELTGICDSKRLNVVDVTLNERKHTEVPDDWYVIEEANIDGIVIWQATNGSVYLTAPGRKARKIADSLLAYIEECGSLT